MKQIKYMTKQLLSSAMDIAESRKFECNLVPEVLDVLGDNKAVVHETPVFGQQFVRTTITFGYDASHWGFIDLDGDFFDALPTICLK